MIDRHFQSSHPNEKMSPAQVQPTDLSSAIAVNRSNCRGIMHSPFRLWKRLQVSYFGGKYSTHRALALEFYTKNTSFVRLIVVCIGTPLPTILFVVAGELIPLQAPEDGWRRNYGFWIRTIMLAFVVGHTIAGQAKVLIDGVRISELRLTLLSSLATVTFLVFALVIASHVVFPVPFFMLTLAPIFYVCLAISTWIMVGGGVFREMVAHPDQLIRYIVFVCAQVMVAFVYPLYEFCFRAVEGSRYQLPVILLSPIVKVAVKNVMLRCTKEMEDMIPEAVIFTVDFFNAIYIATCMQSSSSAMSVVVLTATDLIQTSVMIYGLHRATSTVLNKLHRIVQAGDTSNSVLNLTSSLCRDPTKFSIQVLQNVRIRSCLPHVVADIEIELLQTLENTQNEARQGKPGAGPILLRRPWRGNASPPRKIRFICRRRRQSEAIRPVLPLARLAKAQATLPISGQQLTKNPSALEEALEMLFTIECIIVTAYLEVIVPLLYCCYMVVVVNLPNAKYHTEVAIVTRGQVGATVTPVFVFGLLQLVSFGLLAVLINKKCRMNILYHLAFVLETQAALIQGKLILWMAIICCFRVVHFGKGSTTVDCL